MNETSRIGCVVCAGSIDLDDQAIELLSTISMEDPGHPAKPEQPALMRARPAYAHEACGVPAGDSAVRRGPMRELRPPG